MHQKSGPIRQRSLRHDGIHNTRGVRPVLFLSRTLAKTTALERESQRTVSQAYGVAVPNPSVVPTRRRGTESRRS